MVIEEIKVNQYVDEDINELSTKIAIGESQDTTLDADGVLNYKDRMCV